MVKRKKNSSDESHGTFAQLYDAQQEKLNQRNSKPVGRPPKKVQRKPTTVHLTQSEGRNLSKLHLLVNDYCSANRSELVGVAIDALAILMADAEEEILQNGNLDTLDDFRQRIFEFIKS